MKFVHIADMHFDCPFTVLSSKENLGDVRRLEHEKKKELALRLMESALEAVGDEKRPDAAVLEKETEDRPEADA